MVDKKYFIITIDTEGDNLWNWKYGMEILTENVNYLSRFQDLCDKYEFKPVWLTNYEMINDDRYVAFISKVIETETGECGMHLHAWNTPPYYDLPVGKDAGAPFLLEYPPEIMEEKIAFLTELIENRIGKRPIVHRAGRWIINDIYFDCLARYGYKVDCSITPGVNWRKTRGQVTGAYGSDYTKENTNPSVRTGEILEIPMTILKTHAFIPPTTISLLNYCRSVYRCVMGNRIWLRPSGNNLNQMLYLVERTLQADNEYIMFMIHSSELMPGGSPTFKSEESIDKLYKDMDALFKMISCDYKGVTLSEYQMILGNRVL